MGGLLYIWKSHEVNDDDDACSNTRHTEPKGLVPQQGTLSGCCVIPPLEMIKN